MTQLVRRQMASNPTSFLNASQLRERDRKSRFGLDKETLAQFEKAYQHCMNDSLHYASSEPDFIDCMTLVKEAATNGKKYVLCKPEVEVFSAAFRALDLYTSAVQCVISSAGCKTIAVKVTWFDPNRCH